MDLHQWMRSDLAGLRTRLFDGVARRVPAERWAERAGGGSSLNHLVLHLVRHHDLALNTAIRNHPPLFLQHRAALGLDGAAAGVALPEQEDESATAGIPSDALRAYAEAVFDGTAAWLDAVGSMALDTHPDTARRLKQHAGLDPNEFDWLYGLWDRQAVWWLVQWPVIGHGTTHVGEATGLRNRLGYSPF